MDKTSFITATKGMLNTVREWNGMKIANVGWHTDREWKIVKDSEFDTVKERSYRPVAQFHTRDELWSFIKNTQAA